MSQEMISQALFEDSVILPGWDRRLREEAWQKWQSMAIPTLRDENWKYTTLARLEKTRFVKANAAPSSTFMLEDIPLTLSENRFCFIDGQFNADLSAPLNENTYLLSQGPWPRIAPDRQTPSSYFERLNAALLSDGLYLDIKPEHSTPIYLVFGYGDNPTISSHHLRHRFKLHAGAKNDIIIIDWSSTQTTHLITHIIDIELEDGAELNCTYIKKASNADYHILQTQAHLAQNSQLNHFNFDFGAKLSRNEMTALLQGSHASCQLNGLALARGLDHIDNQTKIEHLAPKTNSLEQYRGIIDDKACHIFHGHVLVDAGAPDSIANQHNKNILLTSTGQAYTEPQLEIYNQNVQCIHGATVGDLDEEALFYLRSRGLNDKQARQLLIFGFARSILETLQNKNLQNELAQWVKTHLTLDSDLISDLYREDNHEHIHSTPV